MKTWGVQWVGAYGLAAASLLAFLGGCGITDPAGDGGGASCRHNGIRYEDGEAFSPDGCNTCRCENGQAQCTLMSCPGNECGGRIGNTCASVEYCAYAGSCGYDDGTAFCQERPEGCPHVYRPVCGCDGNTYSSPCEAASAGTGYLHEGTCEDGPGCRVGNVVYPEGSANIPAGDTCNRCSCIDGQVTRCTELPCPAPRTCGGFSGEVCAESEYCAYAGGDCGFADGSAVCKAKPQACDAIYDPVCACDGKTYANDCEAARAGFGYSRKGACDAGSGSCSFDGRSYPHGSKGIPAGDGCNTCSCENGRLACTAIRCVPPETSCVINGQIYPSTSVRVPDPESCNTCSCENGKIGHCTERYCPLPPSCRVGRAIYQHGHGFVSGDGSTTCICRSGSMACQSVP